ncbi:glycoside hydrolase family 2 protein [Verrucomicrobiaceae bacterium N1E253]|uniref:Beta-mannosidase B n=1 Tax=Oceaniferula marina TaxID=2748318 RepID=A0A851GNI5_9BACT|nr:glycoside hydrolase family 2 protein [Oceaniferula marina]NWK56597.1 glycoside hydrolase family 2 protein [Oceaniferula marina]
MMTEQMLDRDWEFRKVGDDGWLPAEVPGCNHTDLLSHGMIEDPFWRLNEADLQWIDKEDWEYRMSFDVDEATLSKQKVALHFYGLDTYASVQVNGVEVLSADNMFREWWVDVKEVLKVGKNSLRIYFKSPINEGVKLYDDLDYVVPAQFTDQAEHGQVEGGKRVSVHTRKPGYHYGWDWGPRLVSSGIWRPIVLKAWDDARIADVQVLQQQVNDECASLAAVYELEVGVACSARLELRCAGDVLASEQLELSPGESCHRLEFSIENPKLWWCNGLGEAHLYDLDCILVCGQSEQVVRERVGIRTIELVQEDDQVGRSFFFRLNGVPVFMKGANYIPNDIYPTRVDEDKYREVIDTAKASNFNMLRVWGGGYYEEDLFYDLCDEAGILVWQDFMFACAMFPGHDAFLESVRQEAIDNIKRLRNHACLALWCGNNEIVVAWERWGWKEREMELGQEHVDRLWRHYEVLFHELLAEVVDEYDPGTDYWSSSPSVEPGVPSELTHGDEHYWGVWHKKLPYETYSTHVGRFMSEYGFQSFPELKTVNEYALPEDYGLLTDVMKAHQRSPVGNEAIRHYMLQSYNEPKDFEEFLYVGQVLQAELIKYAIEAHRRAMPYCMGTLYWQLNDCWPVASWSSMDSSLRWKAQQFFVKKAYQPVLLSSFVEGDRFTLHVINDHLHELDGELSLELIDFHGQVLAERNMLVTVPANSSGVYFESDVPDVVENYPVKQSALVARLNVAGSEQAKCVFYFAKVKELALPRPDLGWKMSPGDGVMRLELEADMLIKNLYLSLSPGDAKFPDNYFDLLPGESVVMDVESDLDEQAFAEALTWRSISQ